MPSLRRADLCAQNLVRLPHYHVPPVDIAPVLQRPQDHSYHQITPIAGDLERRCQVSRPLSRLRQNK